MSTDELKQLRSRQKNPKDQKKTLLTQIGYLRINIFQNDFEQIQKAEKASEFDKAAQLMNVYAENTAIPWIPQDTKASLKQRLLNSLSGKTAPDLDQFVQQWKTSYAAWVAQSGKTDSQRDEKGRVERFNKLKEAFITVYTYSFSPGNFPPLTNQRTDR
jgi:hypothetical protein